MPSVREALGGAVLPRAGGTAMLDADRDGSKLLYPASSDRDSVAEFNKDLIGSLDSSYVDSSDPAAVYR